MTISILGCGWLGTPLGASLAVDGHKVIGSYRNLANIDMLKNAKIEPFKLSFEPNFNGSKSFFESEILVIAIPPRLKANGENFYIAQINAICDEILISKQIKKVVFISSTSVYGKESGIYTELMADKNHVLTKAENSIQNCCDTLNISCFVLRMGGLMGYDREPCKYLNVETSELDTRVNYVFRDDAVAATKKVILDGNMSGVFNISSPFHPTRREILEVRCGHKSEKIHQEKKSKIIDSQLFIHEFAFIYGFPDPLLYPKG